MIKKQSIRSLIGGLCLVYAVGCGGGGSGGEDDIDGPGIVGEERYMRLKTQVNFVVNAIDTSDEATLRMMRDLTGTSRHDELQVFRKQWVKLWDKIQNDDTVDEKFYGFAEMAVQKIRGEEVTWKPEIIDIPDHPEKPGSRLYRGGGGR